MAKISLRVYNREIEGLIEGGQLEEAIAHCQHILKTFSMHIETYQLLGKAFLEAHRYADAADIFQRILNASPDDFIAHVGMSIIRDDEGKLDEAIWHMERAYEVQPSNPAIQGELRRLYGRRDGVEPAKIRLSRDALANMYAQGELYNQAIAEIRAVLADDPERPDLQVMLARAYFRTGQKVEAAEISAHLLKKYPYCLDALRVLVEVLPGSSRSENTQVYRQRLRLLDPYSSFVTGSVFNSNQVADASVNLDRLEYLAGKQAAPSQPTWAASLGIKLDEEKKESVQPSWLKESQVESPAAPVEALPEQPQPGQALPEFLRAAGWRESDGQPPAEIPGIAAPAEEGISRGEMPDWLKSQLPPEMSESGKPTSENIPSGELPDWLTNAAVPTESKDIPASIPEGEIKNEMPTEDETDPSKRATKELKTPRPGGVPPIESEESPSLTPDTPKSPSGSADDGSLAWLESLASKPEEKPVESLPDTPKPAEGLPDWLKTTVEETSAAAMQAPIEGLPQAEVKDNFGSGRSEFNLPKETPTPEASGIPEIPEELNIEETPSKPAVEGGPSKPLGIEDDTMAWLEGLAAKQGAKAEELLTKPEERSAELPDWIKAAAQEQPPEVPVQLPADLPKIPEPSMPEEAEKVEEMPTSEMPDWLKDVAKEPELKPLDQVEFEQEKPIPFGESTEPAVAPPEFAEIPPETPATVSEGEKAPARVEEDITITTWLKNLDASGTPAAVPPEIPSEEPSLPKEEVPDWLKDLEKPAAQAAPTPEPKADLPDWLRQTPEAAPGQQAPIPREEKVQQQEWAAEETEPAKPAPTIPDEWMPIEQPVTPPVEEKPAVVQETPPPSQEQPRSPVPPPQSPKGTGALSSIPTQDKDAAILSLAQQMLDAHKLDEALKEYGKLIKKGRLLDEVVHDLREALYRYPVDIALWQTLGDAYMRANRLQDALDAYTKAEELLR